MTKVHDARNGLPFQGRKLMFDTNVWMLLENFGNNARRGMQDAYSEILKQARSADCVVVTNDYVLGEFFNRCCKLEYDIARDADAGSRFPSFKEYRVREDFTMYMETVRDTCLHIVDDCEYAPICSTADIADALQEACLGKIDFSDIILREHCRERDYVLVTHDGDFAGCGIDLITANRRLLVEAA